MVGRRLRRLRMREAAAAAVVDAPAPEPASAPEAEQEAPVALEDELEDVDELDEEPSLTPRRHSKKKRSKRKGSGGI